MLNRQWDIATTLLNIFNENLETYPPHTIIAGTIAVTILLQKSYRFYQDWDSNRIKEDMRDNAIQALTYLPLLGPKVTKQIENEVSNILLGIQQDVDKARSEWKPIDTLPDESLPKEEFEKRFATLHKAYHEGRSSGSVYAHLSDDQLALLQKAWALAAFTNPLHGDWPLINLMEAEVISMCQGLFHGTKGAHGIITNGGTSSIGEACKTYVLHARRNGIKHPEIIVPETVHVAFDKAEEEFNVKLIKVPVDVKTGKAIPSLMEKYINKNTCMIVGSAPSFPFGIIDPIEELGEIALAHNIPLHVDSCLGGFITAFAADAGFVIPPCDFAVPGVMSISVDTHKYAMAPKGNSILLFSPNTPATPTFEKLKWMGGVYVTEGRNGSRSGADVIVTWTTLCMVGKKNYIDATRDILQLQRCLVKELKQIDGIIIPYDPILMMIPLQFQDGINSLLVAQRLKKSKWSVNILQTPAQKPAGFHFCLTSVHVHAKGFLADFLGDIQAAVDYAKAHPNEKPGGIAKAYGSLAKGVPNFVCRRIGEGYVKILNTIRGGLWVGKENGEQKDSGVLSDQRLRK